MTAFNSATSHLPFLVTHQLLAQVPALSTVVVIFYSKRSDCHHHHHPTMSTLSVPLSALQTVYQQQKKTHAPRELSRDRSPISTSSSLLASLFNEDPQNWTDDQCMLNAEVEHLVGQASLLTPPVGQASLSSRVDWIDLKAKVTKAVEKHPSLYCSSPFNIHSSIEISDESATAE